MVKQDLKIGAIIQARLGSERLPGKTLLPLPFGGGPALLEHVVRRASQAKSTSSVIVATTDQPQDDELHAFCQAREITSYRGSAEDVLNRFYNAASAHALDIVVRLTGDNPCLLPDAIDRAVEEHIAVGAAYTRTEGLPLGMNIEVVSFTALAIANAEATAAGDREHVTPYLYRLEQVQFRNHRISYKQGLSPALRLTIDYPSDYALLSLVFQKLYNHQFIFNLKDLEELFHTFPWLYAINSANQQRKASLTRSEEIDEALQLLQNAGLPHAVQSLRKFKEHE